MFMSIYNTKQRDSKGRISRLLTKNQVNKPKSYAASKHLHFILIQRHRDKQLLRKIVLGFNVAEMVFNNYPHKPTLYDCCL